MDSHEPCGGDESDSQPAAKVPDFETKESDSHQHVAVDYSDLTKTFGDFQLKLKPRSLSKAARNDPKPRRPLDELLGSILSGSDIGDERGAQPANTEDLPEKDTVTGDDLKHIGDDNSQDHEDEDNEDSHDEDDGSNYDDEYDDFDDDDEDDRSENDENHEFKWLEPIDVEIISTKTLDQSGKPETVAFLQAKLVRRGQIRDDFYAEMEQPSRETSMLGFGLFDRYGRLRSEFKAHPVKKGTGIWGQELDHGDILLIENIFVYQPYRRQQLGQKMVEALLTLVSQKTRSFFAFVWPTVLHMQDIRLEWDSLQDDAAKEEMEEREESRAVAFWRSLGFRRVGSTIWFAMTPDLEHPSRKLASSDDFDPPKAPPTTLHPLLHQFEQINGQHSSPLHQISVPQPRQLPDLLGVLRNCFQEKGSNNLCWASQDKKGNTVLHLAAVTFNAACVEWILSQDFGNTLLQFRNHHGETPLESLYFKLEEFRTQRIFGALTVHVSDKFQGYSESAVRCLLLLKQLGSLESLKDSRSFGVIQQTIRGCTCGQCLVGFLSPRMLNALLTQAELGHDMLNSDVEDMTGPEWVEEYFLYLHYLPARVLSNLRTNKSMRQGFINLWKHIATCLQKGEIPAQRDVFNIVRDAGEWPPVTKNFLERGGSVGSVFLAICRNAMEQDEVTGDGYYQDVFGEEVAKLPECRNDLEFGFVSGECGYRRISLVRHVDPWGNTLDEDGNVIDSMA